MARALPTPRDDATVGDSALSVVFKIGSLDPSLKVPEIDGVGGPTQRICYQSLRRGNSGTLEAVTASQPLAERYATS